ncbi:MAG: 16S rRNA (uracil(1498)-N(3))-methyltransferase [Lachnospiraceae bacterium]|nr:16S rRNA (uracil(1498)-N(3))-methyltransferase [Lachnospiraceae bacterium]
MYRFFVTPQQTGGESIIITGSDVNHIKNVLRMKKGEHILISDGVEREYECEIVQLQDDSVEAKILDVFGSAAELPAKITLFQGLPKSDKMEWIIQKAVELGVYEIVPVATKRAVVKLDSKKAKKKIERWNTIALSAAKQAKRGRIPEVKSVMTLKEAYNYAKDFDGCIIPYEDARGMEHSRKVMSSLKEKRRIGIFIGPEGGFEEVEVEEAKMLGIEPVSLGRRILRTETAGMAVLSILMFQMEEE